jgi:hypothetical protein
MSDIHVLPINDLREHEETRGCWCHPRFEIEHDLGCPTIEADGYGICWCQRAGVIVHNSADGRELVEEHGLQ